MNLSNVAVTRKEWNPGVISNLVNLYFTEGYTWGFQLDDGMSRQEVVDRLIRAGNYETKKLAAIKESAPFIHSGGTSLIEQSNQRVMEAENAALDAKIQEA